MLSKRFSELTEEKSKLIDEAITIINKHCNTTSPEFSISVCEPFVTATNVYNNPDILLTLPLISMGGAVVKQYAVVGIEKNNNSGELTAITRVVNDHEDIKEIPFSHLVDSAILKIADFIAEKTKLKTFSYHYGEKVAVWKTTHFDIQATDQETADKEALKFIKDGRVEDIDWEDIEGVSEKLTFEENGDQPTAELIREDGETIYENGYED